MNPNNDNEKWEYAINTPYEITINYSDNYQHLKVSDLRLIKCGQQLKDILINYRDIKHHFRCEVSMPNWGDINKQRYTRVHHHGIIMFTTNESIKTFLLNVWSKMTTIARVSINQYRPEHWPEYMRKHKHLFGKEGMVANVSIKYFNQTKLSEALSEGKA